MFVHFMAIQLLKSFQSEIYGAVKRAPSSLLLSLLVAGKFSFCQNSEVSDGI